MRAIHIGLVLLAMLAAAMPAVAQRATEVLPQVVQHDPPIYPRVGYMAHLEGDVRVNITTDGQSVSNAEAIEGPPGLREASVKNVKSWKFAPHAPGTFHVTFRYKFIFGSVDAHFLEAPGIVELDSIQPQFSIVNASIYMGTWNVRLKSSRGESSLEVDMTVGGLSDEWLEVRPAGLQSEDSNDKGKDKDSFGCIKGDFLAFTLRLDQPDGKRVKMVFAGKKTEKQITGVFVDEDGVKGEWTADWIRTDLESR